MEAAVDPEFNVAEVSAVKCSAGTSLNPLDVASTLDTLYAHLNHQGQVGSRTSRLGKPSRDCRNMCLRCTRKRPEN